MVIEVSTEPVHISTSEVAARHGDAPWAEVLLADGRNLAVLIADNPGGSNDAHVHADFNEWWVVLQSELEWEIGNYPTIHAKKGDVTGVHGRPPNQGICGGLEEPDDCQHGHGQNDQQKCAGPGGGFALGSRTSIHFRPKTGKPRTLPIPGHCFLGLSEQGFGGVWLPQKGG